jgi:hypothetical protein
MRPRRPVVARAALPATVATALALLAGPGVPSAAAARHAPSPRTGTTLLRTGPASSPGLRAYRAGSTLKACVRRSGERRLVRTLGAWTPATKVVLGGATLAWTTRSTAPDGTASDTIRAVSIADLRRTLTVTRTAVATGTATPAAKDTVVRLLTDGLATVWVTTGGRLAAAVALPEHVPAPDPGPGPFHAGPFYALGDVAPEDAPSLAAGLRLVDDSETDECGGTLDRYLSIPAVGDRPQGQFRYYREEATPAPGCSR